MMKRHSYEQISSFQNINPDLQNVSPATYHFLVSLMNVAYLLYCSNSQMAIRAQQQQASIRDLDKKISDQNAVINRCVDEIVKLMMEQMLDLLE